MQPKLGHQPPSGRFWESLAGVWRHARPASLRRPRPRRLSCISSYLFPDLGHYARREAILSGSSVI